MTLAAGLEAVRCLYLLRRQRGAEFSRIVVEQANMFLSFFTVIDREALLNGKAQYN